MTVEIPPELARFVHDEISKGSFKSEADVVGEALRLLRQHKLYELRSAIDVGLEQLERGEGIEIEDEQSLRGFFEDIKRRGRERLDSKQGRK